MNRYREIFCELFDLSENFETDSVARKNISDWDSVGHIALISKLEESYSIFLDVEDILKFDSFETGITILKKYGIIFEEEKAMSNLEKYNDVFKRVFMVDDDVEKLEYQSIEAWDSVGQMELVAELEEVFGIMLESDDMMDLVSYQEGIRILDKYNIKL